MSDLRRLLFANQTRAYEGYPLVISRSVALRYLKQYQMYGNSEQDGTPTPENPVEVISVGDKTKNLFDKSNLPERIYAYFASSGTTWSYTAQGYSLRFPCLPNTTYTARYNGNSTQAVLSFASTSSDAVPTSGQTTVTVTQAIRQNSPTISTPVTLTTGASDKWLIVQYNAVDPQNTDMANNLQIEQGSTATSYVPYGYQIPVVAQGKNLFDKSNYTEINAYINATTNVITQGTASTDTQYCFVMPCKPNTTYSVSANNYSSRWGTFASSEIGTTATHAVGGSGTVTTGANDKYIIGLIRTGAGTYDFRNSMQIEEGSVATPYAPYGHSTTPIYLNAPLRKVGTYVDVLDYKKGQIIRNVGVKVLDGTESWARDNRDIYIRKSDLFGYNIPQGTPFYITHFGNTYGVNGFAIGSSTFYMKNTGWNTAQDFKDFLAAQYAAGTPVIIYYPLATPVTESIVAPALPTMAGSTTYTTGTEVKPSNMKGVF